MHVSGMRKHSSIWPYIKEEDGGEWNEFTFDKQVNLFVGPNAAGKTALLGLLSGKIFLSDESEPSSLNLRYSENIREWLNALQIDTGEYYGHSMHRIVVTLPFMSINVDRPEEQELKSKLDLLMREIDSVRNEDADTFTDEARRIAGQQLVAGYGGRTASNILGEKLSVLDAINENATISSMSSGYDTSYMVNSGNPYNILGKEMLEIEDEDIFMYLTQSSSRANANLQKAVLLSYHCAKDICADVIAADFPIHEAVLTESKGGLPSASVDFGAKIITNDADLAGKHTPPLHISRLSSGTAGTLWWVRLLAFEMLDYYGFQFGWEKKPMILLIDEIENHLHPTWQRRVIPALLDHFPGLQIFATTHSPFVVAGLKAGQVHMLKRDGNGVVTASTNEHDIIGWTTDEILRTFMGVDEPTDQLTIDRYQRLRELRAKESQTDEEAAEMENLRRQVNEDFLSSSTPLEAQRERYGDMMLEFFRSRQSELSQDGD